MREMPTSYGAHLFPPRRSWDRWDYALCGAVTLVACFLMWSGLSTRSLWGPEGRWAVIVREMLRSRDYFLPTVNGVVDLDKPLLSYWAILPFVRVDGLSEAMLRLPSTLGGIGTVLIVFVIGRRLFDRRTAAISALLLLSSTMFVLWSRTASAESLNTLAIWTILLAFLCYATEGRFRYLAALYCIAALGSFFKGPVAAATGFSVIFLYSTISLLPRLWKLPPGRTSWAQFRSEFSWIASGKGAGALASGLSLFALLLLAPVLFTGSWDSVYLMWKENITRFFSPFDHTDPLSVYLKYVLLLSVPWTLLMLAALWEVRFWKADAVRRWIAASILGIFCFFELSGSRRGYYILPLLPCLALAAAKVMSDWIGRRLDRAPKGAFVAAVMTSGLMALAGGTLLYLCFTMGLRGAAPAIAVVAMVASLASLRYLMANKTLAGLSILLALMLVCQAWVFTYGMELGEQRRTLRSFARQAAGLIEGVEQDKVVLYRQGTASLLFYLDAGFTIGNCNSIEELEKFRQEHKDGLLIIDLNEADTTREIEYLNGMETLVLQHTDPKEREERYAVLRFRRAR